MEMNHIHTHILIYYYKTNISNMTTVGNSYVIYDKFYVYRNYEELKCSNNNNNNNKFASYLRSPRITNKLTQLRFDGRTNCKTILYTNLGAKLHLVIDYNFRSILDLPKHKIYRTRNLRNRKTASMRSA